jgi:phosphoglycerol transferase
MSDHLSMKNSEWPRLTERERRNTLLVLADGLAPRRIERAGSTLDVYPTVLELLGFQPAQGRAGLGVSLLGTEPTLVEALGAEALNALIASNDALSERIWQQE